MKMSVILRLLRPHQYIKNGFVVLGVVFGQSPTLLDALHASVAFVAFCLAASSVYVFNDMVDVESDRMHPIKRMRPIASGAVSLPLARTLAALLAALALGAALSLGWTAALFIGLYLVLNVAYSLRLKHVVILDVFLISAGFMLRILIGTAGIGIPPSEWLLLTGLMLTLFLGFAKRRAELIQLQGAGKADRATVRRVLENYSPAMLDQLTGITAACAILSYGLYTVSPETVRIHGSYALFYTLPFVVYGIFRYLFLLHHRAGGNDTARDLLADRHLIATAAGWLLVSALILR
jgi:4-hydroxybenzoate polyprenyltransferase